jgi:hypothetical protein
MSSSEPRDDQFPELPEDGAEGAYEFPFTIPDDGTFDLDWSDDDGLFDGEPLAGEPALEEDDMDESIFPVPFGEPVSIVGKAQPPPPTAPAGESPRTADRSKPRKERGRRGSIVLGVYVTGTTIYGALLQPTGEGARVLRRFARQRNAGGVDMNDLSGMVADVVDAEDSDGVKIQFGGDSSDGGDLFLDSEFGDLANFSESDEPPGTGKLRAAPFVFELKDLLDECAALGYEKPVTAFCVGQPGVDYVEVLVPDEKAKRDDKTKAAARPTEKQGAEAEEGESAADGRKNGSVKRERLLSRLSEVYEDPFEKDRVGFVPMTTREGVRRYLAIVPNHEEDALAESLDLLREQSGMRSVPLRTTDSEVSILIGLTRWAFPADHHENTAIVRVDSENTLVILLQGGELHHQEHMLSVTTLDGPDTICSRVLLQQDVQGVGTVHQVIVLSEEREDELVRGFSAFYPDARVTALRRGLHEHGVAPPAGQSLLSARALPAAGVALRLILERQKESTFEPINMLPRRLRRSRPKLDLFIAWHTLVTGILLFFTVLFFVGLFFAQKAQISEAQSRLSVHGPEAALTPQALQMRIDSLQSVHRRITQNLNTIDSLLVGSDRWSRSLTLLARSTSSTGGAWVEQWTPQASALQLSGYTVTRDQAVQLAERMNASINELRFDDIRTFPVYSYVLTVPVTEELPEVARYLRDQADVPSRAHTDPLGGALANEEPASQVGRPSP